MPNDPPLPLYVINLDRAPERWRRTCAGLAALGLTAERVPAVDAAAGQHLAVSRYDEALSRRRQGAPQKPGALGCFASHYLLWQRIAESRRAAVVLEDDLEFGPGFPEALSLAAGLVEPLRYLRLSTLNRRKRSRTLRELGGGYRLVRFGRRPMGTQAYALSPAGAERLLAHAQRWYEPVDDYMDAFWRHGLPPLAILPFAVDHADAGLSYIQTGAPDHRRSPAEALRYHFYRRLDALRARLWLLLHRNAGTPA